MQRTYIFLDYDGTLVPFADTPSEALPPPEVLGLLQGLVNSPGLRVAIISGRDLETLRRFLPVKGLFLAACHGGLIKPPGDRPYSLQENINRKPLEDLCRHITLLTAGMSGYLTEMKELCFSFHYRGAAPEEACRVLESVKCFVPLYCPEPCWQTISGKKVLEVRPSGINKGRAILHLLEKWPGAVPLFAGDDTTDEDAFAALSGVGHTILVTDTPRPSAASTQMDRTALVEYLKTFLPTGRGNNFKARKE